MAVRLDHQRWPRPRSRRAASPPLRCLIAAGLCLALSTCSPRPPLLEQIRQLGELRVAIVNGPTTYYASQDGNVGFDYDLAERFAAHLGVDLVLRLVHTGEAAMEEVRRWRAHIGAAAIKITPGRRERVRFAPPLREVTPELVYRLGSRRPRQIADIQDEIVVPATDGHIELLEKLRRESPNLSWRGDADNDVEQLLVAVATDKLRHTVADSDMIALTRRYYPALGVAIPLGEPVEQSWAFARGADDSLFNPAIAFLTSLRASGELERIHDRYFGHVYNLGTVDSAALAGHVESRLPKYRDMFMRHARAHALEWQLLAAVGYQESHWNPEAVSPTGVRGLMMLTRATARHLGVSSRKDPDQSIAGAAAYLVELKSRLDDSIPEPDRTWMTLAAYNLGIGHVYDARKLTRERGGDPDRWIDVRDTLPLLTQERWHRKTRYGYARGHEAVSYVGNVRAYLDVLRWLSNAGTRKPAAAAPGPRSPLAEEPLPESRSPLDVVLPVL